MAKGEARRGGYVPGEPPPKREPAEEGDYVLTLESIGPEGDAGWNRKESNKFPNRKLSWSIGGTTDDMSGGPKMMNEWVTLHPKAFFRIHALAYAAGYPEGIDQPEYGTEDFDHEDIHRLAQAVDGLLNYIMENGISLRASVTVEEHNGFSNNRVAAWLPPEETATETTEAANDAAPTIEEDGETLEEAVVEEVKAAAKKLPPTKPPTKASVKTVTKPAVAAKKSAPAKATKKR